MEKLHEAISCLLQIEKDVDVPSLLEKNITKSLISLNITLCDIFKSSHLVNVCFQATDQSSVQWKFVGTSFYCIFQLTDFLNEDTNLLLSIAQKRNVQSLVKFIFTYGLLPSLLPGVGLSSKELLKNMPEENLNDLEKYSRLKTTCKFITEVFNTSEIKEIIITNHFNDYLAALFQLSFAPIARPNSYGSGNNCFVITNDIWINLMSEQKEFKNILDFVLSNTYQPLLIKELIVLQGRKDPPPPKFLRNALSKQLSTCLISPGGLHSVMKCFLDSPNIDIGAQWKHIDMITRLVSVKHGNMTTDEYLKNICLQLSDIIKKYGNNDYVIVSAACITSLFNTFRNDQNVTNLIDSLTFMLQDKALTKEKYPPSTEISNSIHVIDLCFNNSKLCLPINFLTPIIYSIFSLRVKMNKNHKYASALNLLIVRHFSSASCNYMNWFSALLFSLPNEDISINHNIDFELDPKHIFVVCKKKKHQNISVEHAVDCILDLINTCDCNDLACDLFTYFIQIISKSQKINITENVDNDSIDKNHHFLLILTKALEILANLDSILNKFKKDPKFIIDFVTKFLKTCSENIESKMEYENNEDCMTICLILLSTIMSENLENENLKPFMELSKEFLEIFIHKSDSESVKYLSNELLEMYSKESFKYLKNGSKFDQAISDVCDSLLPVRAHGLIELSKLIEEKDPECLSKKQYVQCIFQENLKDTDSYVYLAAIKGISTLATYHPEDILEILSKEFLNESEKSNLTCDAEDEFVKLRLKIGEILLKITKNLGDVALDHKNILLNTFLCGCHDPDDLLRASSLSNLAELCRVLSYKLGSIIFEILKSIDNIIQNDKSLECRRAAVLVITSLIKGLGKESLFFLKEALLPMYRTLKQLYKDEEEDAAVRLHAQIALEELNDIMKEILAPYLCQ